MCCERVQALEKEMALGGELDSYEFEGPDRAEFLQDLAEFQLAVVGISSLLSTKYTAGPSHAANTAPAERSVGAWSCRHPGTKRAGRYCLARIFHCQHQLLSHLRCVAALQGSHHFIATAQPS